MHFSNHTKLADIIHCNYLLLPVLNRFNIQLGFGDKSVQQVCNEQNLNVDFFLEIINSFHDHEYFPQAQLQSFPLKLIIDYIQKSHRYYLDYKIPQIETLIYNLKEEADTNLKSYMEVIEDFFLKYKEELITHIRDEEDSVYPYVLAIENAFSSLSDDKTDKDLVHSNSIDVFEEEHSNMEDKLTDLKNIIIKYLPPSENYGLSNALLIELFRLERDLIDHARIEDKVLIPKVQLLEKEILNRKA